jgi:tetratricopeptide (TPR) repeat protein
LSSFDEEKRAEYRAAATRAYDAALKDFGANVRVRMLSADHFLRIKEDTKAAPIVSGLLDPQADVPKDVRIWASQQQALLEARSGNYGDTRKALAALQAARSKGGDQTDVNLRLQLQLLQRLVEVDTRVEQRVVYQALLDAEKLTPLDQLRYADLLDSLGAWEEANAQYIAHLTALPDSIPGRIAYCHALLRHLPDGGEIRDLLTRELSAVERKEPNSTRTTLLRARFLAATERQDEATQLVQALIDPRFVEQGEAKYRRFVQQENAVEFFQTVLLSTPRGEPLTTDALTEASKLVRRGELDAAAKLIAGSPVGSFVDQALHSTLQQSIRTLEEWNPVAAESYLQRRLTSSAPRDAALDLAKHLVRQKKMDEALKLCDAQWEQITPAGVAFVVSVIARSADDRQLADLKVWRDRLAASADALTPAEQAHLYTFLGDYDNLTRDYDSAVAQYRKALAADRTRYVPLNNAAFLQARRGKDLDEAATSIGEAIQIAGPRRELVDTRATVLMAKDQLIEARDELQQFVARSSDPATLFRLAECHYKLRDTAQAKTTLDTALANGLDPKRLHPLDQELLEKMKRDLR